MTLISTDQCGGVRHALICVVVFLVVFAGLTSCAGREEEAPASDQSSSPPTLPQIAAVGGVQDVWPFSFGFDATREIVRSAFGAPESEESRTAGTSETAAIVVTWRFPGLVFNFFVDAENDVEQLLSARVLSPEISMRGGLSVGMSLEDALGVLGEPGYLDDSVAAFFYYATTIELDISDGIVNQVVLSRAMP